jgi:hypothetical protein
MALVEPYAPCLPYKGLAEGLQEFLAKGSAGTRIAGLKLEAHVLFTIR